MFKVLEEGLILSEKCDTLWLSVGGYARPLIYTGETRLALGRRKIFAGGVAPEFVYQPLSNAYPHPRPTL